MGKLINEITSIVSNECAGPRLHLLVLQAPQIAAAIKPGQFVHAKIPGKNDSILRRPFSVYAADAQLGIIEILYQEVGAVTTFMPQLKSGDVEMIGPVGNTWAPAENESACTHALLVGGGVGAAPLYMLAETLTKRGCAFDVVLGAQTLDALVAKDRYEKTCACEPKCATDDGSYGHAGFCTALVEERLVQGCLADGASYDYVAVCGPEPLMRIVSDMARDAGVSCEVSMEKRMACGIGACLSCVVNTTSGKRRSCVDGPIFNAEEVVW